MKKKKGFNTAKRPGKPWLMWRGLMMLVSPFFNVPVHGKIKRVNCENLKGPYLMLCNHGSMVDFSMAVKATQPKPVQFVAAIDEFVGREFMFRGMGMIYKRKFTNDITVVRHILHVLKKNKSIVCIYPEARFSIMGINERLDGTAIGKLVKIAKCPVVTFMLNGNFLRSPQWNKHPYRKVDVDGVFEQIVTKEEVETLTADEIQERINEKFHYDEYKWQYDNRIEITSPERATNIHKVLYQCPHCKKEYTTYSKGTKIWCQDCGKVWEMDVYGQLHCENGEDIFTLPSDWYRWERQNVREEVRSGKYHFEDECILGHLQSTWTGYAPAGTVKLTHDYNGFTMEGTVHGEPFHFNRDPATMISCHIEYNYKKRGDAIDLCTSEESYFAFPQNAVNCLTKIHLATEEMHDYIMEQRAEKK